MFAHNNPGRVLVVGGGDGGTVRELLRHKSLQQIDLVEIDEYVIQASKDYLPEMASSLEDPKVSVHIEDGVQFVRACVAEQYDIVIVDSDNPDGISKGLFTEDFYQEIYRILKPDGIMVTQSESPRFNQEIFREVFSCYKQIYSSNNVFCYLMYLPSFPSGMWSFSFSSKGGENPFENLDEKSISEFCTREKLKYYSFDVHNSSFVLPKFVQDILQ